MVARKKSEDEQAEAPLERVLVPNEDDPELGTVVRARRLDVQDDGPEDDEDDAPKQRRTGPPPKPDEPVDVYLRAWGTYKWCGLLPHMPTDDELRAEFPDGGRFLFEARQPPEGSGGRLFRTVRGILPRREHPGFGFAVPPGYNDGRKHQAPPAIPPPTPPPPPPKPTDWPKILEVMAPLGLTLIESWRAAADARHQALMEQLGRLAQQPAAHQGGEAAPVGGSLETITSVVGLLRDLGVMGGDKDEDDRWAGLVGTLVTALQGRQQEPPWAGQPPPPAPPAVDKPAPTQPPPRSPAVSLPAPPTSPEDLAAHAELQAMARALNLPLTSTLPMLIQAWQRQAGGRTDATWPELRDVARQLVARHTPEAP